MSRAWNKFFIIILIFLIAYSIKMLSDNWKDFVSVILVCVEGFLLAALFDITDLIYKVVQNIKDNTNANHYKKSIDYFNELLLYFSQYICSFLASNLKDEYKKYIKPPETLTIINDSLKKLTKVDFEFERSDNADWKFYPFSKDVLYEAEGNLNAIDKMLQFLPKELNLFRDIYPILIDILRGFYQVKSQLYKDSGSNASEATITTFLKNLIHFIDVTQQEIQKLDIQ